MVVRPSAYGDTESALRKVLSCSSGNHPGAFYDFILFGLFVILNLLISFGPVGVSTATADGRVDMQPPIVAGHFAIPTEKRVVLEESQPDAAYLNDFHLRRATHHFARGDYGTAVDELSQCDWSRPDPEMDRTAFLLGMSYLRLGHREGFLHLANTVPVNSSSPFLACLRRQALLVSHHADTGESLLTDAVLKSAVDEGLPFAASLFALRGEWETADQLLTRAPRSILSEYLRVVVAEAQGGDAELHLQEIARQEATTDLEIQLVSLAHLRLARRTAESGGDAIRWLKDLDPASRWASSGNHLLALYQLEVGDSLAAIATLTDLIQADPSYERRDEVERALGSIALDRHDDESAYHWFVAAAKSWEADWAELERFSRPEDLDAVVEVWERVPTLSNVLVLDADGFRRDLAGQLGLALTIGGRDAVAVPTQALGEVSGSTYLALILPHPPVTELRELSAAQVMAEEAYYEWEHNQWQIEQARFEMARRRAYLQRGEDDVDRILLSLRDVASHISLLEQDLPRMLADLADLEAEMQEQILARTARILEAGEALRLRIDALDHFYTDGPHRDRPERIPDTYPSPEAIMQSERALSETLSQVTGTFAEVVPEQIRRSASEIWRPRLIDGVGGLGLHVARLIERAEWIRSEIERSIEVLDRGDRLAELGDEGRLLRAEADRLGSYHQRYGRKVATRALDRRRTELRQRREGVDYALAYAHFVAGHAPEAVRLYDDFLKQYPESKALAEIHYRLADLHLETAKTEFRVRMEDLVERQQRREAVGVVPVLDFGKALRHYEAVLQSGLPFAHTDAVLYHVGVLRADNGEIDGVEFLERLVTDYPESPFVQEAQIRRADFYFDDGRLETAASLYAAGAMGPDPALQAIALYKLGWSFFNRDQFLDAADAFARVLDLYDSKAEFEVDVDLQAEADDYLIHALARLGGGQSTEVFFNQAGERPYTSNVIQGVSSLLRRFSLYGQAVETDQIWLRRYPRDPHALVVAKRIIDGHLQGNQLERARESRLEMADLFLTDSEWYESNPSDSLRREADRFSENSYRTVALFHHHKARDRNTADPASHWSESRRLYERMLLLWPQSSHRYRTEFYAAEAARELGDYDEAAVYFASAARADSSSFALEASWQHVATLQEWYAESPEERDALVTRVLTAGDVFLDVNPYDLRGNDLSWSQGQLAFAHGLDDRAAEDFGRFVLHYSGDKRAPRAASLRGDAFYRLSRFDDAGSAYDEASQVARQAGQDSLAQRMTSLVPHSFYLHAESVEAGSGAAEAATSFEEVARRWPDFEFADNALYRAGSGYVLAGKLSQAESAFEELIRRHPDSGLARDAYLELARAYEEGLRVPDAARLFESFSETFPEDEQADDALLHAADLWSDFGDEPGSERVQLLYIDRFPEDRETTAFVLHRMAERDLVRRGSSGQVSRLLQESGGSQSYLARYLSLEEELGEQFDRGLAAEVSFLLGEEGRADYLAYRLTLPLEHSIAKKNVRLDAMLVNYRRSTAAGVSPWSQAAVYRIGEALIAFGEGLVGSERPADLSGDDRIGYDEILEEQAWEFYDRGEAVWTEILQNLDPELVDEGNWIERTRSSLWPRISQRFLHYAEVDYPVVEAGPAPAGE